MSLSKSQRAAVRDMFGGKCAYCGHPLGERWHADHVKPVMRNMKYVRDKSGNLIVNNGRIKTRLAGLRNPENDLDDNHFPACIPCNIDKTCLSLEDWRKSLQEKINVALRSSTPLRHAQRFGMVHISEDPIVFYFEKISIRDSK